jgi:hypothetical protein
MKRYISAILIPCFLLQLFGCYSTREIALDELQNYDNVMLVTKDSTIYHLSEEVNEHSMINKPNEYFSDYWIVNRDSSKIDLIIQKSFSKRVNDLVETNTITEKGSIPFNEISQLSIEEFDTFQTCLTGSIFLGVLVAIILASFKFGGVDLASKVKPFNG